MALLYERKETADEIIIRYKYYPLLYIFIIIGPFIGCFMPGSWVFYFLGPLIVLFIVIFVIDYWKPEQEIRKAMKKSSIQVSGNKSSFFNPFRAVIKKEG